MPIRRAALTEPARVLARSPGQVLERYTALTGRMRLPPLWSLGYHQARWSYYPESRVLQIGEEFRRRRIPCDVIHLDIHVSPARAGSAERIDKLTAVTPQYMDDYRVFTWDKTLFPDPQRMTRKLHEALPRACALRRASRVPAFAREQQGFKVLSMVDPGVQVHAIAPSSAGPATHPADGSLHAGQAGLLGLRRGRRAGPLPQHTRRAAQRVAPVCPYLSRRRATRSPRRLAVLRPGVARPVPLPGLLAARRAQVVRRCVSDAIDAAPAEHRHPADQYKALLDSGVDAFWNDMNEARHSQLLCSQTWHCLRLSFLTSTAPICVQFALITASVGTTVPDAVRSVPEDAGRIAHQTEMHNLNGLLMTRATAEGLHRLKPGRHFVLTRSGWAGTQR